MAAALAVNKSLISLCVALCELEAESAAAASDGDTDSVGSDDTARGVARGAERCRNGPACFFLRGGRTCMHAHTPAELAHALSGRPSDGWWTCTACDFLNRPANGGCGGAAAAGA